MCIYTHAYVDSGLDGTPEGSPPPADGGSHAGPRARTPI